MATKAQPAAIGASPQSLAGRLSAGALPVGEALGYAIGLAEALREIHRRGRVYGFLNPDGIAVIEAQVRLVPSGPAPISPYFSPEQAAGNDLDLRSDIFSLGAVLYEMLSGRKAFSSNTKAALRLEILNREIALLENVPPALARLVQRCLEKKPQRRVQRIEILLAELHLQQLQAGGAWATSPAPMVPAAGPRQAPRAPELRIERPEQKPGFILRVPRTVSDDTNEYASCQVCGAYDVHPSRARGRLESALVRLGARINRCYRCHRRFLQIAGFTIKKRGKPTGWTRPGEKRASS